MWDITANLTGIALGTILNYSMNSFWTWKDPGKMKGIPKNQASGFED